ncbi:MAG: M14 family zinc carboxypeptidase [Solirubrobacterales bacterium]
MSGLKRGLAAFAIGQAAVVLLVGAAPNADEDGEARRAAAGARSDVVGRSVEGRAIVARRTGDDGAARTVLVVGSIHGDETQGHRVIRRLRRHHDRRLGGVDAWTITTVNPDGVDAGTRKNAHGVDLNRNFGHDFDPALSGGYESGPGPFSEPESRAVRGLVRRIRPDLTIWYHQPWGVTLVPCNHTGDVARRYARLSGLAPRDCHPYPPGSATSWQYHRFGEPAFVVELPGRRLRQSEVRRHARAVATLAER